MGCPWLSDLIRKGVVASKVSSAVVQMAALRQQGRTKKAVSAGVASMGAARMVPPLRQDPNIRVVCTQKVIILHYS